MTDRQILFSGPMVQAILREIRAPGTGKTQTRRVLKHQPRIRPELVEPTGSGQPYWAVFNGDWEDHVVSVPYASGDRLWVRETWSDVWAVRKVRISMREPAPGAIWYWADGDPTEFEWERPRPSIHMPRWASRITLEVTDVRVQLLQEIREADAVAEGIIQLPQIDKDGGRHFTVDGVDGIDEKTAARAFRTLWDSLNADRAPWASNPWVVAISFKPHLCNIDQMEAAA